MPRTKLCLLLLLLGATTHRGVEVPPGSAARPGTVRIADGFDSPVGREGAKRFYMARGFRPNGHLGEDWNGEGGGDTDLGDPVYSVAHGLVVFAQDYKLGWGNVVIIRHAYVENGKVNYVDSLYGHLQGILVANGAQVSRGQKVGTIGNNHGQYDAHLHFEMRKNLSVGMFRNSFPRDSSVYWTPSEFIAQRQTLPGGKIAVVPTNTFPATPPPALPGAHEETPIATFSSARTYASPAAGLTTTNSKTAAGRSLPARRVTPIRRSGTYKFDRYEDLRQIDLSGLELP